MKKALLLFPFLFFFLITSLPAEDSAATESEKSPLPPVLEYASAGMTLNDAKPAKEPAGLAVTAGEIEMTQTGIKTLLPETEAEEKKPALEEKTEKTEPPLEKPAEKAGASASEEARPAVAEKTVIASVVPEASPAAAEVSGRHQPEADVPAAEAVSLAQTKTAPQAEPVPAEVPQKVYKVWRIYSADIFRLAEDEKLVLAGIDAPQYFLNRKAYDEVRFRGISFKLNKWAGKRAHEFSRKLAQGKNIRIELIEENGGRDSRKRMVGYAFLEDGTFINAELVKAGFARVVARQGQGKYQETFKKLQEEAKQAKRGLWAMGYYQRIA